MATSTVDGSMLLIKKLGGLLFVLAGFLGIAIGVKTESTGLIVTETTRPCTSTSLPT